MKPYYRSVLNLAIVVAGFVLLGPPSYLDAQFRTPTTSEQVCTVECPAGPPGPAGRDGRDGIDGKDGKDGKDGAPGVCPLCNVEPEPLRNFDIGIPGVVEFPVRIRVRDGVNVYLLVYAPTVQVAALVDVRTGLAQLQPGMSFMGQPFNGVTELQRGEYLWWAGVGSAWSKRWNTALPWVDLKNYAPYAGAPGLRIFRWTE